MKCYHKISFGPKGGRIKNKIKEIRKKLGITQKRLAQECSVARQTINCIEIINTIPHWSLLFKISKNTKCKGR
ncbi:helix-turn-helix transcriptional regulator [Cytobacillus firmus]|uniref:helix-turn-helix transcriptional regulator n=1 Tax=Cytobacillus firmus TaxID=1399 RepID=UPI0037C043FF